MRILVCGASGFIGPPVVRRLLAASHDVIAADVVVDPSKFPAGTSHLHLCRSDVADLDDVLATCREHQIQRVVHLAFLLPPDSETNPHLGLRVNIQGTANVFEAARLLRIERVVYGSSVAAYGDQARFGSRPVTEDDECFPLNLYGAAKVFNDAVARRYADLYGLDVVGLRIATVFGHGRERGNSAWVGKVASYPALGKAVQCPLPSTQQSAMIYVDDVAEILVQLCLAPRLSYRLYLSGGDTCSLAALADIVRQAVPTSDITFDDSGPDFPHVYLVDDRHLREDVGFRRPPLEQRIRDQMNVARVSAGLPLLS